jgi:hypothetical protein
LKAAYLGRVATHSEKAQRLRGETQARQREAELRWQPAQKPDWLNENYYRGTVVQGLKSIPVPTIAARLRVSIPYATEIRKGRMPHPRHWMTLMELVKHSLTEPGANSISVLFPKLPFFVAVVLNTTTVYAFALALDRVFSKNSTNS